MGVRAIAKMIPRPYAVACAWNRVNVGFEESFARAWVAAQRVELLEDKTGYT